MPYQMFPCCSPCWLTPRLPEKRVMIELGFKGQLLQIVFLSYSDSEQKLLMTSSQSSLVLEWRLVSGSLVVSSSGFLLSFFLWKHRFLKLVSELVWMLSCWKDFCWELWQFVTTMATGKLSARKSGWLSFKKAQVMPGIRPQRGDV